MKTDVRRSTQSRSRHGDHARRLIYILNGIALWWLLLAPALNSQGTIVDTGDFDYPPLQQSMGDDAPAYTSITQIDAADEAAGNVFQYPATCTVSHVHWGVRTVTTGSTVEVRLETVDTATGLPSGTLIGTNTNGSTVIADADDNTTHRTALTAGYAATRGTIGGISIKQPTVSFGNLVVSAMATSIGTPQSLPYGLRWLAGAWSKATSWNTVLMALECNDGVIHPIAGIMQPWSAVNTTTINTGTTPDMLPARVPVTGSRSVVSNPRLSSWRISARSAKLRHQMRNNFQPAEYDPPPLAGVVTVDSLRASRDSVFQTRTE